MSKMKIAIIGCAVAMGAHLRSKMSDGAEVYSFESEEDYLKKVLTRNIHCAEPYILPTWQAKHGKEGRNKSDRKRNRKNRWG